MQILRKLLLYSLWPNLIKIFTLNANTKEIVTLQFAGLSDKNCLFKCKYFVNDLFHNFTISPN